MAFLAAEIENRQLEDLPQADFGRVPKRFLLSVRTKSMTEGFVYRKLRPSFVFVVFQGFFHLANANALYDFYSEIVDPFTFIHYWSWLFLSVKGYCVYMIHKIIHGCLWIRNFSVKKFLNISSETLYGGQFTLTTHLIKPNYLVIYSTKAALPVALKRLTAWMKLSLLLTLG